MRRYDGAFFAIAGSMNDIARGSKCGRAKRLPAVGDGKTAVWARFRTPLREDRRGHRGHGCRAGVHQKDASVHPTDASMHRNDASVHPKDVSMHPNDVSVHRNDVSVHPNDPSAHRNDAGMHPNDARVSEVERDVVVAALRIPIEAAIRQSLG
jgi:hypothetical protein